jgi:hypothetical protein
MRNRGWKLACGVLGALALLANPASAHTDFSTWTLSSYVHDAYANSAVSVTFGSTRATTMTTTMPSGWRIAHADNATSPFGANSPNNGDVVATGTATARWNLLFCASTTQNLTGTWVEPIDSGAPANTVAQINMDNDLGITTKTFITLSSGIYKIEIPDMPDQFVCSSTTNGATALTMLATVSGTTRHVAQNPTATGSKTATTTYVDTTGTSHSDDVSVTIT